MIDLEKLTAAPWRAWSAIGNNGRPIFLLGPPDETKDIPRLAQLMEGCSGDFEFIALARNAFDVMMRRGWSVNRSRVGSWWVSFGSVKADLTERFGLNQFSDPFTALVEADAWYCENVEAAKSLTPIK